MQEEAGGLRFYLLPKLPTVPEGNGSLLPSRSKSAELPNLNRCTILLRSFCNWYTAHMTVRGTKDRAVLARKDTSNLEGW